MKLRCLFGQRECSYPGQHAPELLCAVDEFTDEDNPEYFRKLKAALSNDELKGFSVVREVFIEVNGDAISATLGTPTVPGEVAK